MNVLLFCTCAKVVFVFIHTSTKRQVVDAGTIGRQIPNVLDMILISIF